MGIFKRKPKQPQLTPEKVAKVLDAVDRRTEAEAGLRQTAIQMRDRAMRAVADKHGETRLLDRPGRTDGIWGLVTLNSTGEELAVYEGEFIEQDGSVYDLGPSG